MDKRRQKREPTKHKAGLYGNKIPREGKPQDGEVNRGQDKTEKSHRFLLIQR